MTIEIEQSITTTRIYRLEIPDGTPRDQIETITLKNREDWTTKNWEDDPDTEALYIWDLTSTGERITEEPLSSYI